MPDGESSLRLAKVVLVIASLVLAVSFGFQLLAVWFFVPLQWRASRDSGLAGTAGWALLSIALVGPAALMATYLFGREGTPAIVTAVAAMVTTVAMYWHGYQDSGTSPLTGTPRLA